MGKPTVWKHFVVIVRSEHHEQQEILEKINFKIIFIYVKSRRIAGHSFALQLNLLLFSLIEPAEHFLENGREH